MARDRQAAGGEPPVSEYERAELVRPRRENAGLAMERDVLIALGGAPGQGGDGPVTVTVVTSRSATSHPLVHRGRDGDRRLRVPVSVDLPLQPGKRLLRLDAGRAGLADVLAPAGQRVDPGEDDGPEAARGQRLDVAAGATAGRHGCTIRPADPTTDPTSQPCGQSRQRSCRSAAVPPTGFEPDGCLGAWAVVDGRIFI